MFTCGRDKAVEVAHRRVVDDGLARDHLVPLCVVVGVAGLMGKRRTSWWVVWVRCWAESTHGLGGL